MSDHRRRALDREREPLPSRVDDTPVLPPEYHRVIDGGLAALGLEVPAPARAAIDGYMRLLLAWTRAINLTAIREPVAAASAHVLDSLTAVPLLRARAIDRFLDLGSGGGVPGIPLAAALPAADALLVESVGKKARFLATATDAVGLAAEGRVRVAATRGETLARDPQHRGRWPAVTARAVATLPDLVELAVPLLAPEGVLVAWKRGVITDELEAGRRALEALGGGSMEVVSAGLPELPGHVLVVVSPAMAPPLMYPRDPAIRQRQPW